MKKQNQAPTKKVKTSKKAVQQNPSRTPRRIITLSAGQARKLGPGLPTLASFLPIATDLQLVQLLGAVPFQWSRKELGPQRGEVTLMAMVNPTAAELPPRRAARLRALVAKEFAARPGLTKMIKQVKFIETHASPALLRRFHRTLRKMAEDVRANSTRQ